MDEQYHILEDVDKALEESKEKPLLILKHSITCPISAAGKAAVDDFLNTHKEQRVELVIVQTHREISNQLAETLGVQHESPQFLIIENGKATTVLNHYDITKEAIESALK